MKPLLLLVLLLAFPQAVVAQGQSKKNAPKPPAMTAEEKKAHEALVRINEIAWQDLQRKRPEPSAEKLEELEPVAAPPSIETVFGEFDVAVLAAQAKIREGPLDEKERPVMQATIHDATVTPPPPGPPGLKCGSIRFPDGIAIDVFADRTPTGTRRCLVIWWKDEKSNHMRLRQDGTVESATVNGVQFDSDGKGAKTFVTGVPHAQPVDQKTGRAQEPAEIVYGERTRLLRTLIERLNEVNAPEETIAAESNSKRD